MNLLRISTLALAILVSASACNKNDDDEDCVTTQELPAPGIAPGGCVIVDPCAEPCSGDVVCTMDFRSVSATATNGVGNPLAIDSFVVTDLAGTPLPAVNGQSVYGMDGSQLIVASDAWVHGHQGMQMPVQAKGFLNGSLIFDQAYTIGADCCHVYKAAGPDVIAVQ